MTLDDILKQAAEAMGQIENAMHAKADAGSVLSGLQEDTMDDAHRKRLFEMALTALGREDLAASLQPAAAQEQPRKEPTPISPGDAGTLTGGSPARGDTGDSSPIVTVDGPDGTVHGQALRDCRIQVEASVDGLMWSRHDDWHARSGMAFMVHLPKLPPYVRLVTTDRNVDYPRTYSKTLAQPKPQPGRCECGKPGHRPADDLFPVPSCKCWIQLCASCDDTMEGDGVDARHRKLKHPEPVVRYTQPAAPPKTWTGVAPEYSAAPGGPMAEAPKPQPKVLPFECQGCKAKVSSISGQGFCMTCEKDGPPHPHTFDRYVVDGAGRQVCLRCMARPDDTTSCGLSVSPDDVRAALERAAARATRLHGQPLSDIETGDMPPRAYVMVRGLKGWSPADPIQAMFSNPRLNALTGK